VVIGGHPELVSCFQGVVEDQLCTEGGLNNDVGLPCPGLEQEKGSKVEMLCLDEILREEEPNPDPGWTNEDNLGQDETSSSEDCRDEGCENPGGAEKCPLTFGVGPERMDSGDDRPHGVDGAIADTTPPGT